MEQRIEINKKIADYGSSPLDVLLFLERLWYRAFKFNDKGKLVRVTSKKFE